MDFRRIVVSKTFALVVAAMSTSTPTAVAVDVVEASLSKGQIVWQMTTYVHEQRERVVAVIENGKTVEKSVIDVVTVPMLMEQTVEAAAVKATDAAGNEIAPGKLAELLAKPRLAVLGPIPPNLRTVFREDTVFFEIEKAK